MSYLPLPSLQGRCVRVRPTPIARSKGNSSSQKLDCHEIRECPHHHRYSYIRCPAGSWANHHPVPDCPQLRRPEQPSLPGLHPDRGKTDRCPHSPERGPGPAPCLSPDAFRQYRSSGEILTNQIGFSSTPFGRKEFKPWSQTRA